MIERFLRDRSPMFGNMIDAVAPRTKPVQFNEVFADLIQGKYKDGVILPRTVDFGRALGGKTQIEGHIELKDGRRVLIITGMPKIAHPSGTMNIYLS